MDLIQIVGAIALLILMIWLISRRVRMRNSSEVDVANARDEAEDGGDNRGLTFGQIQTFSLNIVGESNYQAAIKACRVGDQVFLVPEPSNPYDSDAIKVECRGQTIGYISRDRLEWIHKALDRQDFAQIRIGSIGTSGKYLGVLLSIDKS